MELGYVDTINLILLHSYIIKNPYHDVCCFSSFSYDKHLSLFICRDDQYGYTPLMIAAMEGDQIVLDVLIACVSEHLLTSILLAFVVSVDVVPVLSASPFHLLFRSTC